MALNISSADAWTRARDRYVEDLSDDEKQLFLNASLETTFYSASAAKKSHRSDVASKLQTFAAAIEQYGTALDVYANSSSLILCPLWGSVRVVLHLASEFGKYFDKIVGMFERIGDVLPQFRVYERLFSNHERLVQALSVVYVDILKFCTDAKAVFRKGRRSTVVNLNIAMKLLWKPFDQQFGKTIDDFRKHLKTVDKEAGLSHMVEAHDARALERLNRMQTEKQRKEDERLRLLSTLSSTRPEKTHHRLQRLRHPQTGTWLTNSDAFRTFNSSPESSCLRCDGIPGSGKTVLASQVIDTLFREIGHEDSALSYFYCEYSDSRTLETFSVFGSILQQLLSRKSTLPEEVGTMIKQVYAEGMSLPSREDLIDLLRSVLGLFSRTYVVIDGLDECGKDAQEDVLFIVKTLASFDKVTVKVVVFSRDNAHLSTVLKQYPCIHTSEAALTRDIASFVKATVESKLEAGELVIRNPALKGEIISELVTKAEGMFLWVSFQLEDICEVGQSDASIRKALRNLPMGLAETYTRILNKIEKKPPRITEMAQKMLKWVVCTRRPLLIDELKEAIAFEPGDQSWDGEKIPAEPNGKRFVQICGNLLLLNEEEGTVRLAHHTVQQYLLSAPRSSTSHHFHFQLAEAQLYVGEVCVTYLSFSDFETQITGSKPRQLASSGVLNPTGPAYIPSILGYGSRVFDIWYRLRGGDANHKSPNIDFTPILMPLSYQRRPVGRSLQEKYRFLNYTIENWLFHTSSFSADNTKLWGSFRSLAVEKTLAFEFRDWDSNQRPTPIPCSTLYQWASREGHGSMIRLLREPSPLHPTLHTYLEHDLHLAEKLLHCAVRGHADVLQQLLQCHPGKLEREAGALLKVGVENGDENIVRVVLENGGHLDADVALNEPFFCAARNGQTELVLLLLKHGARVHECDSLGYTPLHIAVRYGCEAIVRAVLKAGADVGAVTFGTKETALHLAAKEGHAALVQLLVDSGAAIDALTTNGQTAFLQAVSYGSKVVEILLELGVEVNDWDFERETGLHCTAKHGHAELVQLLVDSGADIEAKTTTGLTALIYAAANRHKAVMQTLLDLGANINACSFGGMTALHCVAKDGYATLVQQFVARGADIEARAEDDRTALMYAAVYGHIAVIQTLLNLEADINACSFRGMTALHFAARAGHASLAQQFVARGADIKARAEDGQTALMYAAAKGHKAVMQTLLDLGADINACSFRGMTALHYVAEDGYATLVQQFVARGADIEVRAEDGRTTLMYAAAKGHKAVMQTLLDLGADINACSFGGMTALHFAARAEHTSLAQLLVDSGADIEVRAEDGRTALMYAAAKGHKAVMQTLLDLGADINACSFTGMTALHFAARAGHASLAQLLVDSGADIEARAEDGQTALLYAASYGHKAVMQTLLDLGADINACDSAGRIARNHAIFGGHPEVIQFLQARAAITERATLFSRLNARVGESRV